MLKPAEQTSITALRLADLVAEAGFDLKLRVVEVATALKAGEDGDFQVYALTWSGRSAAFASSSRRRRHFVIW